MGLRGVARGWKICKKFVEYGQVKLINYSTFSKVSWISCADLDKDKIIIENYVRPLGLRAKPPSIENFCDFFLNFPLATLIFPLKFAGSPPRQANNSLLSVWSDSGGEAPSPASEKLKIPYE